MGKRHFLFILVGLFYFIIFILEKFKVQILISTVWLSSITSVTPGHSVPDRGVQQLHESSHLRHLLSFRGQKFKQVNISQGVHNQ